MEKEPGVIYCGSVIDPMDKIFHRPIKNKITMITLQQKENEDRKTFLVRLAIEYIKEHTGYVGIDDELFYDESECDGYCLADDLIAEFGIEKE